MNFPLSSHLRFWAALATVACVSLSADEYTYDENSGSKIKIEFDGDEILVLPGADIKFEKKIENSSLTVTGGDVQVKKDAKNITFVQTGGDVEFKKSLKEDISVDIQGGSTYFKESIDEDAQFTISGGDITFKKEVKKNATFEISGGTITLQKKLEENAEITVSGGDLTFDGEVEKNLEINLSGTGSVTLNKKIKEDALIQMDGGSLILGKDDPFEKKDAQIVATGGTIETQGNNLTLQSLTVTSNSVIIDLGDDPSTKVNVGDLSGDGVIYVTNFSDASQIQFDSIDGDFNVNTQVFFGTAPGEIVDGTIVPGATPVPEPSTYFVGILLIGAVSYVEYKRRKGRTTDS